MRPGLVAVVRWGGVLGGAAFGALALAAIVGPGADALTYAVGASLGAFGMLRWAEFLDV